MEAAIYSGKYIAESLRSDIAVRSNMPTPPFKLAVPVRPIDVVVPSAFATSGPQDHEHAGPEITNGRRRLADLDGHLHCSVIGTCLGTVELRRLMARHLDVLDASDLDVHHEAVRLVSERGAVARALQKALDQKHAAALAAAARLHGDAALEPWWKSALRQGEVPGAYWAVLTHRDASGDLIRLAFGDVHMLSHLVGSANRADIRRLASVEEENAGLRDELASLRERAERQMTSRDAELRALDERVGAATSAAARGDPALAEAVERYEAIASAAAAEAALHDARRESAERACAAAEATTRQLRATFDDLRQQHDALQAELAALEAHIVAGTTELDDTAEPTATPDLGGRCVLYVGGRPSSTQAIRALVVARGGLFRSHDGGVEDRKGLLAPAVAGADVVLFPVDCIDHDSAGNLKRLCARSRVPFVPLRSAGVASVAAVLPRIAMPAPT